MSPMPTDSPVAFTRRNFLTRSLGTLVIGVAGSTLLASCAPTPAAPADKAAPAETKKPLVPFTFLSYLTLDSLSMAPEMLGVAGGYFAKHGLDVTIQVVKGSPQAMQTLIAGVAPLTRVGEIDVMVAAVEKKQPLVNVGVISHGSAIRIISTEKYSNGPEDWVGKTMGVPSVGGTSDKGLSLMMKNAGLDPDSVKRQLVGLTPATFELVRNGTLVGYMVSIDTALIVAQQNPDARIFDPGVRVKSDNQVYASTPDQIGKHKEELTNYFAAIKEVIEDVTADKDLKKTIATLRSKYSFATLNDDKIAKEALTALRGLWTNHDKGPLLTQDLAVWAAGYDELVGAKVVTAGFDSEKLVDNSMVSK
jgi:NitT/TauT family transport system substrate-binding protein